MRNQRVVFSGVLALVLPVALGLSCVRRDWSLCSPQDECQKGYTCTADWKCVRDVDGGAEVLTDAAVGPAIARDGGEPDSAPVFAPPDAPVSTGPALDGSEPDRIHVAAPPDAPVATVDAPAGDGPSDAPVPDVALIGPTVDAAGTCATDKDCPSQSPLCLGYRCARCTSDTDCAGRSGTLACNTSSGLCVACTANSYCTGPGTTCNTATNQCVGCVKRSDCPGVCQTCANSVCTAVKNQDDPGLCAGTCDSTGACKSKQGQLCQAVSAGCAAGTYCSPDGYCCDKACSGSCEACDVTGSLGTCTTLASGTPHEGHTACITSSTTVCDGKCTGASTACSYPTAATTCGSASCSTAGYQAAGTCSTGTCAMPDVVPCAYACVVALNGCTGICRPNQLQCSAAGIPQKCNANGTWDDTTCPSGNTCSNGICSCSSPNTQCPSGCINVLGSDVNNCGSCGHSCGGGTCVSGQCQPVVIVANPGPMPAILGVDDYNVYYYVHPGSDPYSELAYQVSKGAASTTGSLIDSSGAVAYSGVIGGELFSSNRGYYYMCPFTSLSPSQCGLNTAQVPGTGSGVGFLAAFKSTSQSTFATVNTYDSTSPSITWWSTASDNQVAIFTDGIYTGSYGYQSPFFLSDAVYWIRTLYNDAHTVTESMLYKSSAGNPTLSALSANMLVDTYNIIDVNAKSVLISGPTGKGLYRVAFPGNAAAILLQFADTGSYTVAGATEDANGVVYWMQSNGTVFSCPGATACANKKSLVVGQSPSGDLFADTNSLYWCNSNAVVRLPK